MNTDIAQLCIVLRSILKGVEKGKVTKADVHMCDELLMHLEHKYRAGIASLKAAAVTLNQ